jgi:DNA mismatch repair protein MutS
MTALADKLPGVSNATVTVKEWEGEVIFLHEVRAGAADRSYGVQVAQLAGLPKAVISRAKSVLESLEQGEREKTSPARLIDDLPLFSVVTETVKQEAIAAKPSAAEERLKEIVPDDLTPREALQILYELRELANG